METIKIKKEHAAVITCEEGQVRAIIKGRGEDVDLLPLITKAIQEEYCEAQVTIKDIKFHKSNYSYTITADLIDEGEVEPNQYTFTIEESIFY